MKWWMRTVGTMYLAMFVLAAIARAPIRAMGPPGVLDRATEGDATAQLLVDSWVTLGLEFGTIGIALWLASRTINARILVWAVLGLEVVRGIGTDVYMLARGYAPAPQLVWIAIHVVVIVTGLHCLQRHRTHHSRTHALAISL